MIIDTHAQLFTREALAAFQAGGGMGLEAMGYGFFFRQGGPVDTIADMNAAGVEKSVVVAVDAESTAGFKIPNELVAESVAAHPERLIGFGSVDPHLGRLALKELERFKALGLVGLKFIPQLLEMSFDDRRFWPIYEAAEALSLPVLCHTGTHFHAGKKLKYCQPLPLDEVAIEFPRLKIILAHFGFPWFAEALAIVQRNPNVFFNIAGWAPRHIPEMVITYLNGPLKNKALFGSDHPLLPRRRILDELRALPLKDETRRLLLEDNPKKLLGIS